jgi:predicted transcriptional regulator
MWRLASARNKGELRHLYARHEVKVTPDLRFRIDDMYDRMDATRVMFAEDRVAKDVAAEPRARLKAPTDALAGGLFLLSPAAAVTCQNIEYLGASYTICGMSGR